MSTKKTYSCSDANSVKKAIRITVNGKSRIITFEQKHKNSTLQYSTVSASEQKEIEKLPNYGVTISCIKTEKSIENDPDEKNVEQVPITQGAASSDLQKVIQEKDAALQNKEQELLDLRAQLEALQKGEGGAPNAPQTGADNNTNDVAEYPDITNAQEAKELLRKEPYSVNHQSLKTPEAIRAKAVELGVSFPNWKD